MFDCKGQKTQNINDLDKMEVYISLTKMKFRNEQTRIQITGRGSHGHINLSVTRTTSASCLPLLFFLHSLASTIKIQALYLYYSAQSSRRSKCHCPHATCLRSALSLGASCPSPGLSSPLCTFTTISSNGLPDSSLVHASHGYQVSLPRELLTPDSQPFGHLSHNF